MASYLDGNGLLYFWQKIKNTFTVKADAIKNITRSGTTFTATRADGTTFTFTQQDNNTTYSDATTSAHGLMSAADKTKLNGIASGAEVNQNAFGKVAGLEHSSGSVVTTMEADEDCDTLYISYELSASQNSYTHITQEYDSALGIGNGVVTTPINSQTLSNPVFGQGYGECSTENGTAAKTVAMNKYVRVNGGIVSIKFTADVDANATLNINDCGALPIKFKGAAITAGVIKAGDIATFILNGSGVSPSYELISKTVVAATGSVDGLMSAADKNKLSGIDSGAEVNQNAFSNVKVGSTTVAADGKTDTLELVAGSNVTLTPDATNDKVTIAATNTTYSDVTTSAHGLMTAADKTKLNGIAAGAEVNQNAFSNIAVGSTTIYADGKTDTLTLVAGSNVTLTPDATNDKVTITATDTTYTAASSTPLMDGTGAVGTSAKYAREDHVHPSDTSRVPTTRTVNSKALSSNITLSAADVGAVPTTRSINGHALNNDFDLTAIDVGAISMSDSNYIKGMANGVCPLNSSNKIDATFLPSYVDDVIEAYPRSGQTALSSTWLATGSASGTVITPEAGKIYVLMAASGTYAANSQFRWGGSAYVLLQSGEGISAITNAEIDTIIAS